MTDTVFPSSIADKAAYFFKSTNYLTTNATRLGISATNLAKMKEIYGDDEHENSYVYRKINYDAASGRKDTLITARLEESSAKMIEILTIIYNDIPASVWTTDDRVTLNRKTGLPKTHTIPETPIKEKIFIDVDPRGNGLISIKARSDMESTQHRVPDTAKQVEIRYAIIQGKFPITADMVDKVRKTCIGPNDGCVSVLSTKATFTVQLDAMFIGYNFICWCRWIDIQYPTLAGEWSETHNNMIS